MSNFGNVEPESESTFPFQYNIVFETYQSLEPAPLLEEIDMCTHKI